MCIVHDFDIHGSSNCSQGYNYGHIFADVVALLLLPNLSLALSAVLGWLFLLHPPSYAHSWLANVNESLSQVDVIAYK